MPGRMLVSSSSFKTKLVYDTSSRISLLFTFHGGKTLTFVRETELLTASVTCLF